MTAKMTSDIEKRLLDNAAALSRTGILGQRPAMLEAAAEIATLRAKLAEAEKEREAMNVSFASALQAMSERFRAVNIERVIAATGRDFVELANRCEAAEARATAAEAREAGLRAALEPFARADVAIGSEPGPFLFETMNGYRLIEREDLRRARAALAKEQGE